MDNKHNKIKVYIKKLTSEENSLKKIPFYLFLLGVLLCILIFKIGETNKYLKMIAENGNVLVETHTNDENYDSVLNIYTEDPIKPEDILPNPNEDINGGSNLQETNTNEKNTTHNEQGQKYVINISSKKIHKPDCSFVVRTKDENKKTVTLTSDELKEYTNNDYELCKTCGGE